jgi:hypothetical protein
MEWSIVRVSNNAIVISYSVRLAVFLEHEVVAAEGREEDDAVHLVEQVKPATSEPGTDVMI